MQELELYKLCCTDDNEYDSCMVDELGWANEHEFYVWVSYLYLKEFIESLEKMFGYGIYDDGGFNANMQSGCACIDLCGALEGYIDIESVFPREKYQH